MKVQRYLYGRTNIGQLQSGRASLRSPEAVAAGEYAPYGAVAGAAESISKDMQILNERQQRLQDEDDNVTQKLILMKNSGRINAMKSDSKYQNQMQDDGTPTAKVLLDDVETHISEMQNELEQIQNPRTREQFGRLLNEELDQTRTDMRQEALGKMEAWNAQSQFDLFNIAIEGEDYTFAQEQLDHIQDKYNITPTQYAQGQKQIVTKKREVKVDGVAQEALDVWKSPQGVDGVLRIRDEYLKNPDSDIKTQDAIISKLNTMVGNINATEQKEDDRQLSIMELEVDRMVDAFSNPAVPNPDPQDILDEAASNPRISFKDSVRLYIKAKNAQRSAKTVMAEYNNFDQKYNNDELMEGTAANRKHLGEKIQSLVSSEMQVAADEGRQLSEEDVQNIRNEAILRVNFTDTDTTSQLRGGLNSAEGIARNARTIEALTSDPTKMVDLGLDDKDLMTYMNTAFMAQSMATQGQPSELDYLEAAKLEFENRNTKLTDPSEMTFRQNTWDATYASDEYDEIKGRWNDMWQTAPYDGWFKWGMEQPDTESPEFYDFVQYSYDSFMNGGDFEMAMNYSTKVFHSKNPPNNINGEWESQRDGVQGDAYYLQEDWYEQNKDKVFSLHTGKGDKYIPARLGDIDIDDLDFVNPDRRTNGQIIYDVYVNGRPAIDLTEDEIAGKKPVDLRYRGGKTFTILPEDRAAIKSRMENQEAIETFEDDIAENEKELGKIPDQNSTDAQIRRDAIQRQKDAKDKLMNPERPQF